ncbi:MAG: ATP-dependent helicase [Acidobacteria bacterium]|nr:ATP-dependent helicase [Acidobacteriota bacterium]
MATVDQLREAILAQDPTCQQRDAIFAPQLEFLLRAAPGSGKTWTSCRRFIWRAANWPYPVGGLALLSFTNAAIREFKAATIDLGRRDLLSDPNYVGTFDSFVERYLLAPFGHLLTGSDRRPKLFPGPRPGDWKNKELKAWTKGKDGRRVPVPAWEVIPFPDGRKIGFKTSSTFGSRPIGSGAAPVNKLLSLGFYSHAQRIFWAWKLLRERPYIAELLAARFPEIIVDEAQDTNAWLVILLNLVREKGAKITLIGDPDQCIFEFSMADATSLPKLKKKWSIPEKPLNRSFRCNKEIAAAVRNVGSNADLSGDRDGETEWHRAFVVRETSSTFSDCLTAFQGLVSKAGVSLQDAAVVCRGHGQLQAVRGKANYTKLEGKAKRLAKAAFLRDSRRDYRSASQTLERVLRELTGDDPLWERIDRDPRSLERMAVSLAIWRFVKDPKRLEPVSRIGNSWIPSMREQLGNLIEETGLQCESALGRQIRTTGLSTAQKTLPLFEPVQDFPEVRHDTIHQVKGESIDAVLVIGGTRFWNSVMTAVGSGESTEERRLAYVAMTRARHLLVVGLPKGHYEKHLGTWVEWGFKVGTKSMLEPKPANNDVALG